MNLPSDPSIAAIDSSQRRAARVAGWAGVMATVAVVYANFAIFEPLVVAGNAAETARNILAHETLFRIGVACDLIFSSGTVVMLTALYVVFRPIDRHVAMLAAILRLVYVGTWVLAALNMLGALRLMGDAPYLQAFGVDRLQALARADIAANFDAYYVGLPFFALASTVCAWLWLKSGYLPRALAGFGVIASAWCVFCAFAFLVFPDFNRIVNDWLFDTPMGLFEIVTGLWLVFRGLPRARRVDAPAGTRVASPTLKEAP